MQVLYVVLLLRPELVQVEGRVSFTCGRVVCWSDLNQFYSGENEVYLKQGAMLVEPEYSSAELRIGSARRKGAPWSEESQFNLM